jgi:two-component system response regulator AtoC
VPLLVDHLLDALSARLRLPRPAVTPEALAHLVRHPWPGNVRQLENALERSLLVCDARLVREEDLPADVRAPAGPAASADPDDLSVPRRTAALERSLIAAALARSGGNKAAAARLLELSYKALLYKIRDHGLEGA